MVVSLSVVRLCFVSAVVCLLVLSSILMLPVSGLSRQEEAASAISEAEQTLAQAYNAVLDADRVGANVSVLLTKLNDAADLLARSEIAVRNGDSNAAANAVSVLSIASEVNAAAVDAKETVVVTSRNALWITFAFSVEGAIIFALALFLVWLRYKKSYVKDLFDAKPEVNGQ